MTARVHAPLRYPWGIGRPTRQGWAAVTHFTRRHEGVLIHDVGEGPLDVTIQPRFPLVSET
jgi:hypothetical protein